MSRGLHWSQQDYEAYVRKHNLPTQTFNPPPPVEVPKPKGRQPNKTEAAYGLILEAQKKRGEIIDYAYEGISLKWGGLMRYKADWTVFVEDAPIKLIEVKGGYFWPKDLIRFKGCMAEWKDRFDFEMWRRENGTWTRLF